jgi:hypothetical protein
MAFKLSQETADLVSLVISILRPQNLLGWETTDNGLVRLQASPWSLLVFDLEELNAA